MKTPKAHQSELVPAHRERELGLEREFSRVLGERVMVWSGREDSAWVQWQPYGEVILYDVGLTTTVLKTFGDSQCANGAGHTVLAIALENAGAYINNLSQYPW